MVSKNALSFKPSKLDQSYKIQGQSEFSGTLPRTFDLDSVPKIKDEKCSLCLEKFRKLTDLRLGGSKPYNCTKCGVSICDKCSINKM